MDDGHIWGELLIIILLVLANGACSLAEIAIVGARKTKLQEMIGRVAGGSFGARAGENPVPCPVCAGRQHGHRHGACDVLFIDYRRARPEMGRDRHSGESSLRHCKADDPSCDRLPSARAFLHVVDESRRQSNRRENGR